MEQDTHAMSSVCWLSRRHDVFTDVALFWPIRAYQSNRLAVGNLYFFLMDYTLRWTEVVTLVRAARKAGQASGTMAAPISATSTSATI